MIFNVNTESHKKRHFAAVGGWASSSLSFAWIVCTLYTAHCTRVHCTVHKMLISFAQLCTVWLDAFLTVQKVTKVLLHPTSMKFIIFMFQIIRYSLKWIPNYKIFPKLNIWAAGRCNVGSFVCWLTSHQLKVKREAQISGLNFKLCSNNWFKVLFIIIHRSMDNGIAQNFVLYRDDKMIIVATLMFFWWVSVANVVAASRIPKRSFSARFEPQSFDRFTSSPS